MKPTRFNFADNSSLELTERQYQRLKRQYPFEGETAISRRSSWQIFAMTAVLTVASVVIVWVTL